MNKEKNIKIILNDLYKIDPTLREHEAELVEVIQQLMSSRPNQEITDDFRLELRNQILKMAREIKLHTTFGKSKFRWTNMFMSPVLKPAGLVIGGVLLALIITVPIILNQSGGVVENIKGVNDFFVLEITESKDEAFGKLSLDGGESQLATAPEGVVTDGRGGGGVMMSAESDSTAQKIGMPAPEYMEQINYEYKYTGEDFTIDEQEMAVFQRIKDSKAGTGVAAYLSGLNFQGLDLSKFKNAKVQNFSIVEDKENGYMVSVDFINGMVSVYKNWARWEISVARRESLKMSDIPSDSSTISIANKFLAQYGVDITKYGAPKVQKDWLNYSEQSVDAEIWVPDTLSVIYPSLINGEPVYDMGGRKTGINVSVDIVNMKAVGIWNLTSRQYKSSMYKVETNTNSILEVAKNSNNRYSFDNPDKVITYELGTPERIMMQYMKYEKGGSVEFIVPALKFPVVNASEEGGYQQQNIIVPLTKELLEEQSRQTGFIPMPMIGTVTTEPIEEM